MTSTEVKSAVTDAMSTQLMHIEGGFTKGFAGLQLIGNASEICRDGKERARAALETLNISIPAKRLILSLTPAELKKDGSHFDLPFAVSLALLCTGTTPKFNPARWLFAAELGLNGELRPVRGIVSFAIAAVAEGLEGVVVAAENLPELSALGELDLEGLDRLKIFGFESLAEVLSWLFEGCTDAIQTISRVLLTQQDTTPELLPSFDDMVLNHEQERLIVTVASGLHSLLLRGSPGTGKSMLAARLPSIFPVMKKQEHLEALRIQSAYSERIPTSLLHGHPPFRHPHHQASTAAIIGAHDRPGELSLAHGGILFLDELAEFRRDLIEALREPLETGEVRLSRSQKKLIWKSRICLIAASNNCPCGWFGSKRKKCSCSYAKLKSYQQKLSGPILDRIDIHYNMPEPKSRSSALFVQLNDSSQKQRTARLANQVTQAREFAKTRNQRFGIEFNRDLEAKDLVAASGLDSATFSDLINTAIKKSTSNRSMIRMLRVARTLADMDQSETIRAEDLHQAWSWQAEPAAAARGEELFM